MAPSGSFLILFPIGLGLAIVGIGVWIPHVLWPGLLPNPAVFHSRLLTLGFSMTFTLGTLCALLPKALGIEPIGRGPGIALSVFAPALPFLVLLHAPLAALGIHLLLIGTFLVFGLRPSPARARVLDRSIPLLVLAWTADSAGAVMGFLATQGSGYAAWSRPGALLEMQAFPLLILMGLGSLYLPALFGTGRLNASRHSRSKRIFTGCALGSLFLLSYAIEIRGSGTGSDYLPLRAAYGIRFCVWAWFLFAWIRIHKARVKTGPRIRAMRGSLYATGMGLVMPVFIPRHLVAWEHIIFITGFLWLSTTAVAEWALFRFPQSAPVFPHPFKAKAMRALRFTALLSRVSSDIWARGYWILSALAAASAVFVLIFWATAYLPLLFGLPPGGRIPVPDLTSANPAPAQSRLPLRPSRKEG